MKSGVYGKIFIVIEVGEKVDSYSVAKTTALIWTC